MNDTTSRDKLWHMIKRHKFAMLTTREANDDLRSRPMTTIDRDFDGSLWFFAKADSAAVIALERHREVSLSYGDSSAMDFVSVSGSGSVVTDTVQKKTLWNQAVQAWFPEGPESAENVLIRVEAHHAEYWDSTSSKLMQLFSMARARASGTVPRNMGEHAQVTL